MSLSMSLLADALGGDLDHPARLDEAFLQDFLRDLPDEGFRISRQDVVDWLKGRGVTPEELARRAKDAEHRLRHYRPQLDDLSARMEAIKATERGHLRAQRFDIVPADFEAALYVDLMEYLKGGGWVIPCSRCGEPIAGATDRHRARWRGGRPVYHAQCAMARARERKRADWLRRSRDPAFRQRERQRARHRRMVR